ncbi:MAG: PKD domain-containing protein [Solirubrobacteraceae bacterium]|nr:PKD domain-containing protein [Solirubrobacteraceae bacterium]
MTRRRMRVGAVLAALLASGGERASAATFCVADPSCTGAQVATLADAAVATALSPDTDIVVVGAGTFSGARFGAGNPVQLTGAGRTQTTVEAAAGESVALELADPSSTVRLLGARVPDQDGAVGLRLGGAGDEVTVAPANPAVAATAVELLDGAVLLGATAESPVGDGSWAVDVVRGGTAKIERVRARGAGLRARAATLTATRARVEVTTGPAALADEGGVLRLDTTLVRVLPGAAGGLRAHADTGHGSGLTARGVTLIGASEDGKAALSARGAGIGANAIVRVDDSILRGFRLERLAEGELGGDASVTVAYSNFDGATDLNQAVGSGQLSPFDGNENRTYGTIRFLDSASGDYHLRADSPVIDRGTPGALLPEESPLDLEGLARVVDGNGIAGATRDMGAYEYQRRPPLLAASAQPALAPVGTPMHFEAQVSDPDPGDDVSVRWAFDDGGVIAGLAGDYAFATPGPHSATVTATDSAGAETTRTVLVRALPPAPVLASSPVPPPDLLAPRFDFLSSSLRVDRSGRIPIRFGCPASELEPCRGTLLLRTLYRVSTRPKGSRAAPSRVTLAWMTVKVYPGGTRVFRPKLRAAGIRLMRRRAKVRARMQVDAYDPAGNHRLLGRNLTLRAAENASREPSR